MRWKVSRIFPQTPTNIKKDSHATSKSLKPIFKEVESRFGLAVGFVTTLTALGALTRASSAALVTTASTLAGFTHVAPTFASALGGFGILGSSAFHPTNQNNAPATTSAAPLYATDPSAGHNVDPSNMDGGGGGGGLLKWIGSLL